MRNLELKFRCSDLAAARHLALELGARDAGLLRQDDTFFHTAFGRLKLRNFGDGHAELIAYTRPDTTEVRESNYSLYTTEAPEVLLQVLSAALNTAGSVRKQRRLLLYGHTRIHLDRVEDLGSLVKLETVPADQGEDEAEKEPLTVVKALRLSDADRIAGSYLDLLAERQNKTKAAGKR